jgi:hypothetical protein
LFPNPGLRVLFIVCAGSVIVQLLIAELGCQHLVELQFARSLSHHHRVAHAGVMPDTAGGNHGEELHVMQVRINDENLQMRIKGGVLLFCLRGGYLCF